MPGPSAALAALVVSGLPTDRFCFEGFLPRRGADRRRRLEALAAEERTVVLFEAPGRLAATLADLVDACGPERAVVVARELTKLHEEVWRGTLAEARPSTSPPGEVRGEVVVVLAGRPASDRRPTTPTWSTPCGAASTAGDTLRDAAERRWRGSSGCRAGAPTTRLVLASREECRGLTGRLTLWVVRAGSGLSGRTRRSGGSARKESPRGEIR